MRQAIRVAFPKLDGTDFELLKAASRGRNSSLIRLCMSLPVPPAAFIRTSRATLVYIRPLQQLELVSVFDFWSK